MQELVEQEGLLFLGCGGTPSGTVSRLLFEVSRTEHDVIGSHIVGSIDVAEHECIGYYLESERAKRFIR